jgi:beta-phosphoglucomutase-like phosphatase (HAD superfamily)
VPIVVAAGDTPRGKPAPDPYQLAMERLSAAAGRRLRPEASVAIEDSRWGLESARSAGLLTVGLTTSYPAAELGQPDLLLADIADATPTRLGALVAASLARGAGAGA